MQSDKVNRIILLPGLKELEQLYTENSYSIKLLEILFKGIQIDANEHCLSLIRKDGYHCRVISLARSLNGLKSVKDYSEIQQRVIEQLKSAGIEEDRLLSFKEASDILGDELLLSSVKWYEDRIIASIDLMHQYNTNPALKKKKLSSIIDEL